MPKTHTKYDEKRDYEIVPQNGKFAVKDTTDRYPKDSSLAGQPIICFVDDFNTFEEAIAQFPTAQYSHPLIASSNSYSHL